ncbi:hypothetical protein PR048_015158 [Dryococelus australis]|uniref:Uncharacterized protein n=1 Tax=Dryococelus australis TaxID=614101 RepID=A0ABQ9HGF6_9NEOP|nr:hypothetical protein PR048_015158 [Dryococelus australis]
MKYRVVFYLRLDCAFRRSYPDMAKKALGMCYQRSHCSLRCHYLGSAKRVSTLFQDRLMMAMETDVNRVEYVIRHRGAPHMRSAAVDMPIYQYLLLDVISVISLVATFCICIAYFTIMVVLRSLSRITTLLFPIGSYSKLSAVAALRVNVTCSAASDVSVSAA